MTDLDSIDTVDRAGPPAGPPAIPIVMLAITTMASVALTVGAVVDGAGSTDDVSTAALLAWALGSFLGLMEFAWFGTLDARRRATGRYVDASWNARAVGLGLAVVGWVAGAAAAVLVVLAVARR